MDNKNTDRLHVLQFYNTDNSITPILPLKPIGIHREKPVYRRKWDEIAFGSSSALIFCCIKNQLEVLWLFKKNIMKSHGD